MRSSNGVRRSLYSNKSSIDYDHPYLPNPNDLHNYQAFNKEFKDVREYLTNNGHELPHRIKMRNSIGVYRKKSFSSQLRQKSESEQQKVALQNNIINDKLNIIKNQRSHQF